MKLTEPQIEDLYAFTRKHFVEYYDLQTELVDHLANDIENMWLKNPKMSFDEARDKAFKKFGIFGFMEPIEQKQKAMNKKYLKYFWNELKAWFGIPKIVMTLAIFLLFYILFSTEYIAFFSISFYLIIGVFCIYKSTQLNRQFRRRKEKSGKKWMMEEMIFKQAGGTGLIIMSQLYNVFHISEDLVNNDYAIIGLSLAFTAMVILNYISFTLIPNKAEELLSETYPEFAL